VDHLLGFDFLGQQIEQVAQIRGANFAGKKTDERRHKAACLGFSGEARGPAAVGF
jgi:hypothetical protein